MSFYFFLNMLVFSALVVCGAVAIHNQKTGNMWKCFIGLVLYGIFYTHFYWDFYFELL